MARRTFGSRRSGRGVFRTPSRIYWDHLRRGGVAGGAAPVRVQTGAAVGVAAGTATSVKVAAQGGGCTGVSVGSGTARRSVGITGLATATAGGSAAQVKRALPTGPAAATPTAQAGHSRISRQSGAAVAVADGRGRVSSGKPCVGVATSYALAVRKVVASSGGSVGVAVGSGVAGRRVAQSGTCVGVAGSDTKASRRASAGGVGGGAASVTVRFAARITGAGIALGVPSGMARKSGIGRGVCTGVGVVSGLSSRRAPTTGSAVGYGTGFGAALRRVPSAGGCFGLGFARSFPVVSGPTTGTRVSPPLAIPEGPVGGSRIVWAATLDGGTLLVETSIDNGASWQTATNGGTITRLVVGDARTARTVLTRVTMTRATPDSPSPRLHRLEVEVAIDSSVEEVVPVGVFTLNEVDIDDSAGGLSIELAGADLSRRVSRNRWEDTYIVVEGTNYATAIQDLVLNRLPDVVFNFASTGRVTPRMFFGEQSSNDPWQDAQDMAVAIGHELFFDARGICTLRPEPDPEVGDSVWEFEDLTHPTIVDLSRRVTDENTFNKVIVTGEGSGNTVPVRATAIDDDPSSPTYYLGPYGIVATRLTSSLVLSTEQAQDAANAMLRRVKGATEAVEMSVIPMPALEPGDVVTVTRGRSKVEGRFLLDQIRIPLGADEPMRAVGRRQRQ